MEKNCPHKNTKEELIVASKPTESTKYQIICVDCKEVIKEWIVRNN